MNIITIIVAILIVIFLFFFYLGKYFFNFSENPVFSKKKLFKKKSDDLPLSKKKDQKWFEKVKKEEIGIKSYDNLKLHAYKIKNKSKIWVIIVHGYTNSALEVLTPAKHFYDMGYNLLIIDQRAHGKSDGKYSSMGWIERKDIISWINYLNGSEKNIKIILYGISMGANAVMMAVGEKLPKNVIGAIEDCGFLSIYHQFYNQLKYLKHLPKPIIWSSHFFAKILIKFNIYKADGFKQIQKGKIPMLFIHGEADKFVPISNFNEAYNLYNGYKEKLIVTDAKHMMSSVTNEKLYWETIKNYINTIKKF
jgi:uncharacterized protein